MFISRFLGRASLLVAAIGITQVFGGEPNLGPSVPELSPISVSALLGLPSTGQVAPENAKRPCTGCAYVEEPTDFVLQGSYYDTRRFDVTLILNNKGPDPLPVELTVYSLHGRRLDLPPQELPAQSANMLSLNELLRDAGTRFREGSIEVRYRYEGCALVLSAGILLEDPAAGISFDELLTRTFQRASNRLEALWWVPSRSSKLELVLSNQSESPLTATVSGRSLSRTAERRSLSVDLGPRETRVLNLPRVWTLEREMGRGAWAAGSLSVTYEGAPRDLVARGMVEDRALRYSGVVEFSDPAAGVGPELHGAGWRLGEFEGAPLAPVLVVRNIADEASTVVIGIPYSEPEGGTGRLELEPVALEPGEIRDLSAEVFAATQNLARLQDVTLGLELTSTGAPGTLLAAAESVSLDGNQVFRVPLIDPQTKGAAGNYPWRVDEDVSTVVYLKNVTSEPRDYTVQFDFDGGSYVVGMDTLDPGETVAIEVRELRDSQRPDVHGTIIPPDASRGQVHWSAQGEGAQHSMLGRAEYVDATHGFSSTFACSSCCPDSVFSTWLNPLSGDITVGDPIAFWAFQQNQNCYGTLLGAYVVPGASWSSSDTIILGSLGNGNFQGFLPGSANAESSWGACSYYYINYPIMQCQEYCHYVNPHSGVTVQPPPTFDIRARAFIMPNYVGPVTDLSPSCPGGLVFKGDNRTFKASTTKYRTQSRAVFTPGPSGGLTGYSTVVGETRSYAPDAIADGSLGPEDEDGVDHDCILWNQSGYASTTGMHVAAAGDYAVHIYGGAGNPLVTPSLDIDWDYSLEFDLSEPSAPTYSLSISHDCYPAHEVYVGSTAIYTYPPSSDDPVYIEACLAGIGQIWTIKFGSLP